MLFLYAKIYKSGSLSTPPHRAAGGAFDSPIYNIMNDVCTSLGYRVLLLHGGRTIAHIIAVVVSLFEINIIIRLYSSNPISILSADKICSCNRCLICISKLSLDIEVILGIVILNIFITVRLLMTITILFLGVAHTWSLLHHDHLLGFSASLLYYA
jgi:hypothetical protein